MTNIFKKTRSKTFYLRWVTTMILLSSLFLGIGFSIRSIPQNTPALEGKEIRKEIIILIHGTVIPFPQPKSILNSLKHSKNFIQNIHIEERTSSLRKNQPISPKLGLDKIATFNMNTNTTTKEIKYNPAKKASLTFAKTYINHLQHLYPTFNKKITFYNFGWNGMLSRGERQKAAADLYNQIVAKFYNKKNKNPQITIIAHSHGGNVALNLAQQEEIQKNKVKIKHLILLGTPIQKETEKLVSHEIFETVYNIFSTGDKIQIMDIFTSSKGSSRTFKNIRNMTKIKQISIKTEKVNPNHLELWFFGWSKISLYRHYFALHPYPVACYLPFILHFLNNIEKNTQAKNTIFEIKIEKKENTIRLTDLKKQHSKAYTI